ncbi:glycosyl hydrolase [Streptomyces sp. SID4985]|uniref:glycosyl hydrolase n=1 Tax=Streptomyces sp. SID4985 TaxID=2690292 RepID=UPI001370BEEF|nr:glycosyl hydrolase [Streptomyces sp. SID4985]MYQ48730.1 glycosyl hydrolase [Streptomyces sp. SID4985]
MNDDLDFDLGDLAPADAASEEAMETLWAGDLTVLSQHHTAPHGSHSFVLAHDRSVTWGIPGGPQVVAIAVARDLSRSTFTLETSYHAAASFAQNWLVERGCPPERIALVGDEFVKPADDLTVQVEQQIRESGTRYEVLDTYTSDFDPGETWTLTRDSSAAQAPVRVFHEEWDHEAGTYTMREGAFADAGAARSWLDDRDGPLPEPPEYSDHNGAVVRARIARIALARSADAAAIQKAIRDTPNAPPAGPAPRPVQGRPL